MDKTCFVAHQYTSDFADELREGIKQGLEQTGFEALYAERVYRAAHILDNVRRMILSSAFAIFDLTESNPNVFLELGVAVAARKPIYIICRRGTGELPADVQGIQRLDYSNGATLAAELRRYVAHHWRLCDDLREELVCRHCLDLHAVEDLYHRLGQEREDADASTRLCWQFTADSFRGMDSRERWAQHAVHGPYRSLPSPGLYKAYFRLKVDDAGRPDQIVVLDVYSYGNPSPADVKGELSVRGIDFAQPGRYQLFSVPFGYGYEDDIEFRIRPCARGVTISADYVAILSSARECELQESRGE